MSLSKKAFREEVSNLIAIHGYAKQPILTATEATMDLFYEAHKTTGECAESICRIYGILGIPSDKERN